MYFFFSFTTCLPKADRMPTIPSLPAKSVSIPPVGSGLQTLHIEPFEFGINQSFPADGNNGYKKTLKKLINKYWDDHFYDAGKNGPLMPTLEHAKGKMVLLDYGTQYGKGLPIPNTEDTNDCELIQKDEKKEDCVKPNVMPTNMTDIPGTKYKLYVQNNYDSPSLQAKLSKFTNNLNNSISGKAKDANAFI